MVDNRKKKKALCMDALDIFKKAHCTCKKVIQHAHMGEKKEGKEMPMAYL